MHENDVDTTLMEVENVIIKTFLLQNCADRFSSNLHISWDNFVYYDISTYQPLNLRKKKPGNHSTLNQKCQSFLKFIYDIEEPIRNKKMGKKLLINHLIFFSVPNKELICNLRLVP